MTHLITLLKQAIGNFFKTSRFRDERLIIVLLIVTLSTVFIFGNDRGLFYKRYANHDWTSSSSMTQAANLSPEHNFLMFYYQTLDDEGKPTYVPYNRYPIGGYILLKLVILPFQNDFSSQIHAARMLTLIFFSATVVLAYLALARIADSRWAALAAAMLAFSSYYLLYYSDLIGESVVALFGIMLVFHGMVIFMQEGRFRQLLVKTCIALLLGWHVYALLLVFIILGIANELMHNRSASPPPPRVYQLKRLASLVLKSRYFMLGIVALTFGSSVLAFNFANEYLALNRETPLTELPSFQSMLYRTGIRTFDDSEHWLDHRPGSSLKRHLNRQSYRIGAMSIPYYLPGYGTKIPEHWAGQDWQVTVLGSIVFIAALAGLFLTRHKMLMATLILFGIVWGVIMLRQIVHLFESLFLIGIPLAMFSVYIDKLFRRRMTPVVALAALIVFAISAQQISSTGHDEEQAKHQAEVFEDFEAISRVAKDKIIYIDVQNSKWNAWEFTGSAHFTYYFFLADSIILLNNQQHLRHLADFVIEPKLKSENGLLTPRNKHVFMYNREVHDAATHKIYDDALDSGPVISSQFDVYMNQNAIFYIKEQCSAEDAQTRFFLHVNPVAVNDLPEDRRQSGFDRLNFNLSDFNLYLPGGMSNQKCAAWMQLPEYHIASVNTGQYISDESEPLWSGSYDFLIEEQYRAIQDIVQAAEPVIRSQFDVYLDQNTLFYIKEQCSSEDTRARFLLHLIPIDVNDLPEEHQQSGFGNLDFEFDQHGGIFNRNCVAQIELPEYGIASFRTGQYISGEGELWSEWYEFPQARQ